MNTKSCTKCKVEKDTKEFSKKGKGFASYCKPCQNEYSKEHYKKNKEKHNARRYALTKKTRIEHREKIRQIKESTPCYDCNVQYPSCVMEFDHLKDKIANIADMLGKFGWETIEKEMAKCDIVCANCHRIRTWNRSK